MAVYRKLPTGDWGVMASYEIAAGQPVTVVKASGATKTETIGKLLYTTQGQYVYEIAARERPAAVAVGDLSTVLNMFKRAKSHLKYPSITLQVAGVGGIRINVAGPRASQPGTLTVVSSEKSESDDRRAWYGRVQLDGRYEPSTGAPAAVAEMLKVFAANPEKVAGEQGRLAGACCFCNIALTDERSTAVGYGRTCAEHYGLPWGKRPAEFAAAAA